jgi:hypothetical protein
VSLPFLLEIGTEEIPDWMIVPALNNLQDMFQALLDQHVLGGKSNNAMADGALSISLESTVEFAPCRCRPG